VKGCPFNNFGPCRKEECMFFLPFGDEWKCIIHSQYFLSFQVSLNILDLISVLARLKLLEPSAFESDDEYHHHLITLKDEVDSLIQKLQGFQRVLKDVKS